MMEKVFKLAVIFGLMILFISLPYSIFAQELVEFNFKAKPTQENTCITNTVTVTEPDKPVDSQDSIITEVGSPTESCTGTNVECDGKHAGWPVGGFIGQGPYSTGSHQDATAPAVDIYPQIQGTIGDPVYATICGKIGHYGEDGMDCGGNGCDIYAQIIASDFQTYFVHLDTLAEGLVPGMEVKKGDLIGYRGQTGQAASGPHTHYMIKNGSNVNLSKEDFNKEVPPYDCPVGGVLSCHYDVTSIYEK